MNIVSLQLTDYEIKNSTYLKEVKPELILYDSPETMAKALTRKLLKNSLIKQSEGKPFTIALCGGNSPQVIYREFAQSEFTKWIPWKSIHLFWGDDRCVPPEHEESNYRMARDLFIKSVPIPNENVHRILGENNPELEVKRYEEEILSIFIPEKEEPIAFDWIFLGLGEDGHTASLFPGKGLISEGANICTVAKHPQTGQKRITMTLDTLNKARQVSFLSIGKKKATVIGQIMKGSRESEQYPAKYVNPGPGRLNWIIDQECAEEIKKKLLIDRNTLKGPLGKDL